MDIHNRIINKLEERKERREERRRLMLCEDCGVNTFDIDEYYMVKDEIWFSVCDDVYGMLCIGCLEERLGRRLTPTDFMDCKLMDWKVSPAPWRMKHLEGGSDRLLSRVIGN